MASERFPQPAADPEFLRGGGLMGERIARHGWASSPLGPIDTWPQSLRTLLSMVLTTGFPMCIGWGPRLIVFHNDAYTPLLGLKDALGRPLREIWAEAWDRTGPIVARALAGENTTFEDLPVIVNRHGAPEQAHFTFCYSPIRVESGAIGGVACTVIETTGAVLLQKRTRFQLELADGLHGLGAPEEITQWACSVLGQHLDARRVGYAFVADTRVEIRLPGWHDGSVETVVGQSIPLEAFGTAIAAELTAGRTVRLSNVHEDPRTRGATAAFDRLRVPAMLLAPVLRHGALIAVLAVGAREPRAWTDGEAALVQDTAERTRSAVERALAEQARARDEAYYRFILDRTLAAVVVHDPDGTIAFANPMAAEILGVEWDGIQGRLLTDPAWRFIRPDGSPLPLDAFPVRIVARTREPLKDYLMGILPPDAPAPAWMLVNAFPQFDDAGRLQHTVVSFVDISSRVATEQRLTDADRRKDEFLAMLAHELRNPLAPISTAAQLLMLRPDDPERVRNTGGIIARQATHMTRLMDDLLDVSRVTRGLVRLAVEPVALSSVVAVALEQTRPLIEQRGHRVSLHAPADEAVVSGDHARLVQVVANLLGNAARYTPPGGAIDVRIEACGPIVELAVADNGSGIDPALLPRVFDLFSQGERSLDRSQGGLGIGLALVRSLVELHGGRVRAESAGHGRGSTFRVCLPRASAGAVGPAHATATVAAPGRTLRVLIVDDNIDAALTLADLIGAHGHRVDVAHTGADALALAATGARFDGLVLDIGLPDMDGYALAAALQASACCDAAAFVALTGYGQPQDRELSRQAGFAHHFVKPVDAAALMGALQAHAAGRH